MSRQVTATDAKNNFGGLLDLVAAEGRVEITKHGRVVAVVVAPGAADLAVSRPARSDADRWGREHMIPPEHARAARVVRRPEGFDDP